MTRPRVHRDAALRRRDALLRAATAVVGEQGTRAATHRAIAARAGLPPATTSYFFGSLTELLEEATRTFTQERAAEIDRVSDALEPGAAPDDTAALFASVLLSGDRSTELAQIEAYLHAARTEDLRDAVGTSMDAFERTAVRALTAAGARRPADGARAFTALVDGFVLQHLARPGPDDEAVLREALRALFIAYAMDDDERARWDGRLAAGTAPAGEGRP